MQSLTGTMWRLIEASAFDDDGHELSPPLGKYPMGFVMFEAERMMGAVIDGSLALPTDVPSRAFAAYSGTYRFDGSELVTSVDSASSPDLAGQQTRARADEMKEAHPKAIMLRIAADYEELAEGRKELSTLVGQETDCALEPRRPLRLGPGIVKSPRDYAKLPRASRTVVATNGGGFSE
jgi:hypothetical protein